MKRQHIAIIRDHSGSMGHLTRFAKDDYNMQINCLKGLAKDNDIETSLTVVECGQGRVRNLIHVERERERIEWVPELYSYDANGGGTPLFDSVGKAIEILEKVPTVEDVSFLVLAITDGENNQTYFWNAVRLAKKIQELQATDRWTFAFRVPRGYKAPLVRMGIPEDNIMEWEQTKAGVEQAAEQTRQSYQNYYTGRASGQTSTTKFFTNLVHVTERDLQGQLTDISHEVMTGEVMTGSIISAKGIKGEAIQTFVETRFHDSYVKGHYFYQLVKDEKVQESKLIVLYNKKSGCYYAGHQVRVILGLPQYGEQKVIPGNHGEWVIYVQSTSTNRILPIGTRVLRWKTARTVR